jgi:hypothetical protein
MSLAELGPFSALFTLEFDGRDDWVYQVRTRYDNSQVEYNLEITGVTTSTDPGDVRLVNLGGVNQMIGPGTDNYCVQFPDEMDTGVLFISPVDLVDPGSLSENWRIEKEHIFLDREVEIHTANQDYYFGWENIEAEMVIDNKTGAILSYTFDAVGADPLYGNGGGKIHGEFIVDELTRQKISPIDGCEIPVPIPDDASNIVILPGLYSFNTALGPVKMDEFYDQELLIDGWGRESALVDDSVREGVLVYFSETKTLTVHIQAVNPDDFTQGYQVKLYLENP